MNKWGTEMLARTIHLIYGARMSEMPDLYDELNEKQRQFWRLIAANQMSEIEQLLEEVREEQALCRMR